MTAKAKCSDLIDKAVEEVKAMMRKPHRNPDDLFHIWFLTGKGSQVIWGLFEPSKRRSLKIIE